MMYYVAKLWRLLRLPAHIQLRIMRIVNDEFLIGLTAVIFNGKDEVLLVKHTYRQIEWSLPGGYLKAKEHPTEGLVREIREETGLAVKINRELRIATDRSTGRLDMRYVGDFVGGEFRKSAEVVDYGFFAVNNLPPILPDQVHLIREALNGKKARSLLVLDTQTRKQRFIRRLKKLLA